MPVFALLIISKAGSLIYHRTFPTATSSLPSSSDQTSTGDGSSTQLAQSTGTLGLPGTTTLTTNDYLVLAGTFHGVHAITRSLTPKVPISNNQQSSLSNVEGGNVSNTLNASRNTSSQQSLQWTYPNPSVLPSGIESLESSFFRLTVFQSLTGTKFLLFTDPSMPNTDTIMKGVYDRYADFVCKNPFWQMEMPIRIEAWDRALTAWLLRR